LYVITLNDKNTHTHSVGFLWTSDQADAETSTWQHTTLTRDRHPWPRRHSKPQPQQASGRTPTPYTARPPSSFRSLYFAWVQVYSVSTNARSKWKKKKEAHSYFVW